MAKVLIALAWLQLPAGDLFVVQFCSFDQQWAGFRKDVVLKHWQKAAEYLAPVLEVHELSKLFDRLTVEDVVVTSIDSTRAIALGFQPPDALDIPEPPCDHAPR